MTSSILLVCLQLRPRAAGVIWVGFGWGVGPCAVSSSKQWICTSFTQHWGCKSPIALQVVRMHCSNMHTSMLEWWYCFCMRHGQLQLVVGLQLHIHTARVWGRGGGGRWDLWASGLGRLWFGKGQGGRVVAGRNTSTAHVHAAGGVGRRKVVAWGRVGAATCLKTPCTEVQMQLHEYAWVAVASPSPLVSMQPQPHVSGVWQPWIGGLGGRGGGEWRGGTLGGVEEWEGRWLAAAAAQDLCMLDKEVFGREVVAEDACGAAVSQFSSTIMCYLQCWAPQNTSLQGFRVTHRQVAADDHLVALLESKTVFCVCN